MSKDLKDKLDPIISQLRSLEDRLPQSSSDALLDSTVRDDLLEIAGPPHAMLRLARAALQLAISDVCGKTLQFDAHSNLDRCDMPFNLVLSIPTNIVSIKR